MTDHVATNAPTDPDPTVPILEQIDSLADAVGNLLKRYKAHPVIVASVSQQLDQAHDLLVQAGNGLARS